MIGKIIKAYFNKDYPDKDKQHLYDYIEKHPDEFLDHFDETEWDRLVNDAGPSSRTNEEAFKGNEPVRHRISIRRVSVAAALIAAIAAGGYFFMQQHRQGKEVIAAAGNEKGYKEIFNHGTADQELFLPDSSVVVLMPNSSIRYYPGYNLEHRDIYLEGAAIFKVHKDVDHKFSVFCDSVVTTALGTQFMVSNSSKNKVVVKLLSGRVVVSTAAGVRDDSKYYLAVGNSISYDMVTKRFETGLERVDVAADVSKENPGSSSAKKDEGPESHAPASLSAGAAKRTGKSFDNKSLGSVLEYLSHKYNTNIQYPTLDISKITFIGTIHSDDSLSSVLKAIAIMNDFTIDFDASTNTYTIHDK